MKKEHRIRLSRQVRSDDREERQKNKVKMEATWGEGPPRPRASVLGLVGELTDRFTPLATAESRDYEGDQLRAKWRSRARGVCMQIILATGQTLASRADAAGSAAEEERREDEVSANMLALRLGLARVDRDERCGAFLGGEDGKLPNPTRAEALERLVAKSVVPTPVLRLLALLSPHSACGTAASGANRPGDVLAYDPELGRLLKGFLPSKARGLVPVPLAMGDDEEAVWDDDEVSPRGPSFFSESRTRARSELEATTSEPTQALALVRGNGGGFFAGTLGRLPAEDPPLPVAAAMARTPSRSAAELAARASPSLGGDRFGRVVEKMGRGFLASEVDLSRDQAFYLQGDTRGTPAADIKVVRTLLDVARGSLESIPRLLRMRLCWADYVSTQQMCADFVRGGVAVHNAKCLVQSLGQVEADPITQAFAATAERAAEVIDAEVQRIFAAGGGSSVTAGKAQASLADLSVSEFHEATSLARNHAECLADLLGCTTTFEEIKGAPGLLDSKWREVEFPAGVDLLDYLYRRCDGADGPERVLTQRLFLCALEPFSRQCHEASFAHLRTNREEFVAAHGKACLDPSCSEGDEVSGLGLRAPPFLKELEPKIRLCCFQYNILKEFDHCVPVLSFLEHLSRAGEGAGVTLDATELERVRDRQDSVACAVDEAIDGLLSLLRTKRSFKQIASQTASRAKTMSVEKSAALAEEAALVESRRRRERRRELAEEMKSAAAVLRAARVAARSAEREADRLRLAEETQRRSEWIQEASGILREQAALRMKRVQKEIDRLNWRRQRMLLQPKRLSFEATTPESAKGEGEGEELAAREPDAMAVTPTILEEEEEEKEKEEGGLADENPPSNPVPVGDEGGDGTGQTSPVAAKMIVGPSAPPSPAPGGADKGGVGDALSRPIAAEGIAAGSAEVQAAKSEEDGTPAPDPEGRAAEVVLEDGETPAPGTAEEDNDDIAGGPYLEAPLPEALQVCVAQRVDLNYRCVSRLCVRYFLEEIGLADFFGVLRKVYLLEAGNFGHTFLSHVVEKGDGLGHLFDLAAARVSSATEWSDAPTTGDLGSLADPDLLREFLRASNNAGALAWLGLAEGADSRGDIAISWPYSLFVTPDALEEYQLVFAHLYQFKYLERELVLTWQSQQRDRRQRLGGSEGALREALLCNRMLRYVNGYLQKVGLRLQEIAEGFCGGLVGSETILEANRLHREFLCSCLDACFLRSKADAGARNLVQTSLQSIGELLSTDMKDPKNEARLSRAERRFENATAALAKVM